MTESRDTLIEDLVADLRPTRRAGRTGLSLLIWLVLATVYSLLVLRAAAPMRAGALGDLVRYPFFALETVVAALAVVALAHAALRSAIPGPESLLRRLALPAALLAAWIAFYVVGLEHPAHPVSTLGERSQCIWQAVLFSLPSLALMLWYARRLMPLEPWTTGLLAGAAAAAVPGAIMQFACMYVPSHILTHHIGPVFIVAALGAVIGRGTLGRRITVPRGSGLPMH